MQKLESEAADQFLSGHHLEEELIHSRQWDFHRVFMNPRKSLSFWSGWELTNQPLSSINFFIYSER
jgi:hypothetical protein